MLYALLRMLEPPPLPELPVLGMCEQLALLHLLLLFPLAALQAAWLTDAGGSRSRAGGAEMLPSAFVGASVLSVAFTLLTCPASAFAAAVAAAAAAALISTEQFQAAVAARARSCEKEQGVSTHG
jgi:hypothetical protein